MKLTRIAMSATIGALGAAAALTLGGGSAAAAPSGSSAAATIGSLQAQGNNVVVNKVGTGPMEGCSVTSVRSVERQPLPTGNPLTGVPNLQRKNTVHVNLSC